MNRFLAANLACLGLIMLAVVVGAVIAGLSWWAVLLASFASFFGGGWVIERLAPGTRLLHAMGWSGDDGNQTTSSDEGGPDGNQ